MKITEIVIVAATAIFVKSLIDRIKRNENDIKEINQFLDDEQSVNDLIDSLNYNENRN